MNLHESVEHLLSYSMLCFFLMSVGWEFRNRNSSVCGHPSLFERWASVVVIAKLICTSFMMYRLRYVIVYILFFIILLSVTWNMRLTFYFLLEGMMCDFCVFISIPVTSAFSLLVHQNLAEPLFAHVLYEWLKEFMNGHESRTAGSAVGSWTTQKLNGCYRNRSVVKRISLESEMTSVFNVCGAFFGFLQFDVLLK